MRFSCFFWIVPEFLESMCIFYHFLRHLAWVLHKHYIFSGMRVFLVCVECSGFSLVLQYMYYVVTKFVI